MSQHDVRIDYDRKQVLGNGVYGIVFQGKFGGNPVAVKRTPLFFVTDLITKDEFLLRIRHQNVVIILHISRDEDFRFTVMELCVASLDHLFLQEYKVSMPSNEQVLLQLANGLGYLHSLKILHGDIKPENILISSTGKSVNSVQMKWTGFGFRQSNDSYSLSMSGPVMGSRKWWPPEMYEDETKASEAGEIFSAGCVFVYFLSGGIHPFGSLELAREIELKNNVRDGNPVNLKELDRSQTYFGFVQSMIEINQEKRIPLWNVIDILEIQQRPALKNPMMITETLKSLPYEEKNYLNGKYSCGLFLSESGKLAVKRIPKNYCLVKSCEGFKQFFQFNISNVVRTLHFEEIGDYSFCVMEFCFASLDHLFLPEKDPKRYKGSMPSHEQFFFQLVTGLKYIHGKNLVHGSIKPSNILIYSENDPLIKLSDFGLNFPRWNDNKSDTGFQSDHYWIAPELHLFFTKFERKQSTNFETMFKPTVGSDFYALGKVFFYYYWQTYAILNGLQQNAFDGSHEEVFKKLPKLGYCKIRNENYPNQLFIEMAEINSNNRLKQSDVIDRVISYQLTSKGELNRPKDYYYASRDIQFSRDHILGKGGQAVVYLGLWRNSIAAIKRINTRIHGTPEVIRELEFLQSLNHPNIVKFFGYEKDNDFMYIAIEKCLISLKAYCQHRHLYQGVITMRSNEEVLLQLAKGMEYIHSQHLIHGDVKPANILISSDNPTNLKFADFGLSKSVQKDEINSQEVENWSFLQGTKGWMAPELIINCKTSWNEKAGQKCDIFALGCVFFFFLVPAFHPFGNNKVEIIDNIKKGNPANLIRLFLIGAFKDIIHGMIELNPEKRSEIVDVITKLAAVKQFEIEMRALTEASARLSVKDDQPNPKRQKN